MDVKQVGSSATLEVQEAPKKASKKRLLEEENSYEKPFDFAQKFKAKRFTVPSIEGPIVEAEAKVKHLIETLDVFTLQEEK